MRRQKPAYVGAAERTSKASDADWDFVKNLNFGAANDGFALFAQ